MRCANLVFVLVNYACFVLYNEGPCKGPLFERGCPEYSLNNRGLNP